jgi:four helix bundle protein
MATVKQFEDLLCWQKARLLTKEVYGAFRETKDRGFTDQIQRAAVSVMSNIAEGFESGTKPEFLNYLYIAKGSAGEVRAQLYAAYDIGYLNTETFKHLNSLVLECSRLVASFIRALKSSEVTGSQHKTEKTKHQKEMEEYDAYLRKLVEDGKKNKPEKDENI